MRNLKLSTFIQFTLIAFGLTIGVYFSIKGSQKQAIGHSKSIAHTTMHHDYLDISNDSIIPELRKLEVTKDPMHGWNLHFETKHFRFTPEHVSSKHIPGEGHAHLMINGEKVARIYSNWFHLPIQDYEIRELEITLNSNSHAIMVNNEKIISIKLEKKLLPTQDYNLWSVCK